MTRCWFCVPIYLIQEPWIMVRTLHRKRLAVMASQWFTQTNLSRKWSERRKFDVERSKRTSKRTRGKKYVAISSHENNMIRCPWLIMWALFWALLSWLKTYIQRQPQRQWQATEHHFYFIWTPLNRHNWTRNVSEMIRTNEDGGKISFHLHWQMNGEKKSTHFHIRSEGYARCSFATSLGGQVSAAYNVIPCLTSWWTHFQLKCALLVVATNYGTWPKWEFWAIKSRISTTTSFFIVFSHEFRMHFILNSEMLIRTLLMPFFFGNEVT